MRVLDPGHSYALDNLMSEGETVLQFFKDPVLHNGDGYPGPSCQEVLRAVIDRVQELDRERPDVENAIIVYDLRHAIAAFEGRAMRRRVEKDGLAIELVPRADDGHLALAAATGPAKTPQAVECEASQSGLAQQGNAQTPSVREQETSNDLSTNNGNR